jgi:hypothetical protein
VTSTCGRYFIRDFGALTRDCLASKSFSRASFLLGTSGPTLRASLVERQWQREGEGRAGPWLTLHPDPSAVELDELP